jgi:heavy metal sensor kinase
MFYKSIRFKITIVYTMILALTLSAFSAALYHNVRRSLYENMDSLLRSRAEGIVHAINTYWATERLGAMRYGIEPEEAAALENIDFATIAQRWVEGKSKDPKMLDVIVRIFDSDGVPIASSKNTQGISSVSRENLISVLMGNSCFDTVEPSYPTRKIVAFRVFITPAVENDKVEYIVQVASPLDPIGAALYTLRITLFILFPITVLLTGITGAFLAKLTLRPVDSMIKTIHSITAENMKLKLAVPDTRDEIMKLAETFNDMLLRLDSAFTSQKHLFEDLSHELKTPLTVLKGEFEVTLKKIRSPEEYENLLKSGLEEIDKISKLADNLLMLASFESKRIMPDRKRLDLGLLIQAAVNSIRKLAGRKNVGMALSGISEGIAINGDEQQLKLMVLNLVDNAVKYTPAGGRVTVALEQGKDSARIKISDTGRGIAGNELPHIFDRFYRAEKSRSGDGFGLGLSIAKSIVEAHDGHIEAASAAGSGATFIITLPL